MSMGHEDVMDVLPAQPGVFQLRKDSVPASGVHKQQAVVCILQREAGIVAPRRKRVSRAEHRYLCMSFDPKSL